MASESRTEIYSADLDRREMSVFIRQTGSQQQQGASVQYLTSKANANARIKASRITSIDALPIEACSKQGQCGLDSP